MRKLGKPTYLLDGDDLRGVLEAFDGTKNYERDSRLKFAFTYSRLCQSLNKQHINVVVSTISLFHEIHEWNREHIPGYFEVYIKTPLNELKKRDSKLIYSRFFSGDLLDVAGLDLDIDEPKNPDIVIKFKENVKIDDLASEILQKAEIFNGE